MLVFKNARLILTFLFFACSFQLPAQTPALDSLRQLLINHPQQDTTRVNLLNQYGLEARKSVSKEAFKAFTESLELARKVGYIKGEAISLLGLGFHHRFMDETKLGLTYTQQALKLFQEFKDTVQIITCLYNLSVTYSRLANYEMAIKNALDGLNFAEQISNSKWMVLMNYQLGNLYIYMKDADKGLSYFFKSLRIAEKVNDLDGMTHALGGLGTVYDSKKQWDSSLYYYKKQLANSIELNDPRGILQNKLDILSTRESMGQYEIVFKEIYSVEQQFAQLGQVGYLTGVHYVLASAHLHSGNPDSTLHYAFLALNANKRSGRVLDIGNLNKMIADAYAMKNNYKEAYRYQDIFSRYMDSVNITNVINRASAQKYSFDMEKKQSEISLLTRNQELVHKQNKQQKILLAVTLIGLLLLIGFSIVLGRNNRSKQKAYNRLEQQQAELKSAQTQLIQSEKMASLGELTAGIAHEIQNPLNFVNNFSEVSTELVDEMNTEIGKGNFEDVKLIGEDLKQNLEKINHHGKRAGDIVKGMLQHSRSSSGVKEPTDINALCDEYLRLSYHGLRAKDKNFNATMITDFDESIGKINIIPQDIGRVILNLINNAFYVVNERFRQAQPDSRYEPTVTVATKRLSLPLGSQAERREGTKFEQGGLGGRSIEIKVSDNGGGIPKKILDKIFQPFFTTKPTGQGTGLGLSLSYDIVKAHGGEIKVQTSEGEGSGFIISLPINY